MSLPTAALRQVSEQFWEPVACHLLIAGWVGLAHCARGLDVAACQTRRPAHPVDSQAGSASILDQSMAACQTAGSEQGPAALVQCLLHSSVVYSVYSLRCTVADPTPVLVGRGRFRSPNSERS